MRRKTQLEAAGAEHLVLGHLLRLGIQAFITSQNFEAYDIVAVNPKKNLSIKIQVKSRFSQTATAFPIKKTNADIVVFVKLNVEKQSKKQKILDYEKSPQFFILDMDWVKKIPKQSWAKVSITKIKEKFRTNGENNWNLIKQKLQMTKS